MYKLSLSSSFMRFFTYRGEHAMCLIAFIFRAHKTSSPPPPLSSTYSHLPDFLASLQAVYCLQPSFASQLSFTKAVKRISLVLLASKPRLCHSPSAPFAVSGTCLLPPFRAFISLPVLVSDSHLSSIIFFSTTYCRSSSLLCTDDGVHGLISETSCRRRRRTSFFPSTSPLHSPVYSSVSLRLSQL